MTRENKNDWPEKYDINKLISIQEDIDKVIKGDKVSERRNDRYADAGDEIQLNNQTFIVSDVYPQKLKEVSEKDANDEGYPGLEEYKDAITSIHHEAVWDPEQVVWAHYFQKK
ncbi:MAG TPA: ASCH domain-containing protein [Pseudogracilibacillus sp.]|nr:ASCH domain-containing protein [Pseudogracilibacillus sp.]